MSIPLSPGRLRHELIQVMVVEYLKSCLDAVVGLSGLIQSTYGALKSPARITLFLWKVAIFNSDVFNSSRLKFSYRIYLVDNKTHAK
jgi:hypothetical protein